MTMNTEKENSGYLWYIRNDDGVKGPFTVGMMRRFMLIGRLKPDHEVSQDKKVWSQARHTPEVIPDEMKNVRTDEDRERLLQAQLREDERARERRKRESEAIHGHKRKGERRRSETPAIVSHRELRNDLHERFWLSENYRGRMIALLVFVFILIITGLTIYVVSPETDATQIKCGDPAKPGVNWRNCKKEGVLLANSRLSRAILNSTNLSGANLSSADLVEADLSYANLTLANLSAADLRNAKLMGAGLRNANLSNANLSNANLSFADLRGADLSNANLKGAKLDKAIWVDGTVCAPGSLDGCREIVKK
jgi:hypothetical protein